MTAIRTYMNSSKSFIFSKNKKKILLWKKGKIM